MNSLVYIVLGVYVLAMTGILLYCLLQLSLAIVYWRYRKQQDTRPPADSTDPSLPIVTVQLPIYNEFYVVERLLNAIAKINYPPEKLDIQILDDSTDETTARITELLPQFKAQGIQMTHLHREDRTGFKAGALAAGLPLAKGELVAIFDADFVPGADFLLRTVPYFSDPTVGVVQTRWQHINQRFSILTRIQAFALDVHFSIEQRGRNKKGYYINFNGTAGIWRKTTIEDAGGWSADTLTEDLDLSYRAQVKNWRFVYVESVGAPAELPANMQGYKSQQFRWNKGGAETAKKIIPLLLKAPVSGWIKLHGIAHLLNSSVYLFIWLSLFISVPLLWIMDHYLSRASYNYLSVFIVATLATAIVFFIALYSRSNDKHSGRLFIYYFLLFPAFLAINLGLSFHNAVAVIRGWVGQQTPFVRTPKYNLHNSANKQIVGKYLSGKLQAGTLLEGLLIIYFAAGLYLGIYYENYGMLLVHVLAVLGFSYVFYQSIRELLLTPRR